MGRSKGSNQGNAQDDKGQKGQTAYNARATGTNRGEREVNEGIRHRGSSSNQQKNKKAEKKLTKDQALKNLDLTLYLILILKNLFHQI